MAAEDELWEHIVYTKPIHTNDGAGHHSVLVHKSRFPARQGTCISLFTFTANVVPTFTISSVYRGSISTPGSGCSVVLLSVVRSPSPLSMHVQIQLSVLLLLRTWAIWGRSRTMLICLGVLLVVCMLSVSGLSLYCLLTGTEIPSLNSIRPCLYTIPNTNIFYTFLVGCVVFDSTVLILTLVKIVPAWQPGGVTPLITQLLKDGIQYFVMIFLIGIANIVMIHVAPAGLTATLSILYMVAASTLGCRLILNLRGSVLRSTYNEEDTTTDLNTLVFNNHPNGTIAMHEYRRSVMRRMAQ